MSRGTRAITTEATQGEPPHTKHARVPSTTYSASGAAPLPVGSPLTVKPWSRSSAISSP